MGLVLVGLGGLAFAVWAVLACAPAPLPGDELWAARRALAEAVDLVLRLGSRACFTGTAAGAFGLWLGARMLGILAVLLALIVLWESVGRRLRRIWFRRRGGHVVLAGLYDDLRELVEGRGRLAGTFFLAPDRQAAADIARHRPFAEIEIVEARKLGAQLARLGAPVAAFFAAATRSDLTNVAIADGLLGMAGRGELLVRLEQHSVRMLSSHRLRLRAGRRQRSLAIVSLTQLQARRGIGAAMPGRYTIEGAPRVHIALCGSGPGLQAASFGIARQGYGLERHPPLLSILRTGQADFAAGALHRLQNAGIAEIGIIDVMSATADGLDSAIGAALHDAPPLAAIHCVGDTGGEAEALALRWEEVLLALGQPVPPIVAYAAHDHRIGVTGMIRVAAAQDLAHAHEAAHLMDRRARAVHQAYLDGLAAAGGASAETPAATAWERLPEAVQDDNRNAADQIDYALATVGMLAEPGTAGAAFDGDEIERLSSIAHSRWMAAKGLGGWRHAPVRDDRALLHPDMLPYDRLTEAARQKDRDIVVGTPHMAALAGEVLRRERRVALARPLAAAALDTLCRQLAARPKAELPVVVIPLDTADMVHMARRLLERGLRIAALLGPAADGMRADDALAPLLADVLLRSWRIHAAGEQDAAAALAGFGAPMVDETGAFDVAH